MTTESRADADAIRLSLETGIEVQTLVKRAAIGTTRPKCLLLHGNPGSLVDWKQLLPRLSPVADVAAIDLPGFGRSSRPSAGPESLNLDCLAQHAIAAASALSWHEPVLFAGHSHGGGVAQTVAARYPELVAGLVLVGTLGTPAHGSYRLLSLPGAATLMVLVGGLLRAGLLRGLIPASRASSTRNAGPSRRAPQQTRKNSVKFWKRLFGSGEQNDPLAFRQLIEKASAHVAALTAVHDQTWGLGDADWNIDQMEGTIIFDSPKGIRASAAVQIVGTFNVQDGTWLWGWANPSVDRRLVAHALRMREYGDQNGIPALTTAKLKCDEERCWELTAATVLVCEAQGAYRGPADTTYVFTTFGEPSLTKSS